MAKLERPRLTPTPIIFLLLMMAALAVNTLFRSAPAPEQVPYSELVAKVRAGEVARVEIRDAEIVAELKKAESAEETPAKRVITERLPRIDETQLIDDMRAQGVEFSGKIEEPGWGAALISWLLPLGLIAAFWFFGMRRLQSRGGPMSFGKNRAKVYDASKSQKFTFQDVAGVDEAVGEMTEVVDFLKNPGRYRALGAKIPKGVLLVGPPGTGKTLLAKAVAGEANVPFFSLSGSEFVEMFVGVGAARVRDLFEQAKARSPCIIFIDEIDAIGKSRGGIGAMATHDEREQTLNQLLAEMDGFDATQGVVIIAATNRPEVLDQALVRAGRFDRQVVVDRPSWEGRLAILKVHARGIQVAPGVDLEVVARRTPGMVGADLAKVVNEAALAAARRSSKLVEQHDFEEAVDRIQLGLRKRGSAMNDEEKRRVAYHEAGHAITALSVERADPVHRVTIIPRTIGALGATLQLPTEERYLMLRSELRDRICVMLGGRAAEVVTSGEMSTGAQNDLERATETARQMVTRFGMSDKLGPQSFGRPGAQFLDNPFGLGNDKNYSEETARAIDAEVRALLDYEDARARRIVEARRDLLDAMAERLLRDETLERKDIDELVAQHGGSARETRARLARVAP